MDFIQRARYFIMYVDTKRTRDGRAPGGKRCKNTVGEKQYASSRSDRRRRRPSASPPRHSVSQHETNTRFEIRPRYKKGRRKKSKKEINKKRKKWRNCRDARRITCGVSSRFYFDFDTNSLFLSLNWRMEYFREAATICSRKYSLRTSLTSIYLRVISYETLGCSLRLGNKSSD